MIKKYNYIIYILILIFFVSCGRKCDYITDYYPYVYKGLIEYERKNDEKAYFFLNKAFKACPAKNTKSIYEMEIMAKVSAKLGYNEVCYDMLVKQLGNGFKLSKYTNDSTYSKFFSKKLGLKLLDKSNEIMSDYLSSIDTALYFQLLEMNRIDQQNRGTEDQKPLDSINEMKLIDIFESNRYPKESLLRYKPNGFVNIHTILLHTRDSMRINYFLPKIKELVREGRCDPYVYATLYDQYYLYNGMPQIYGTYKNRNHELSEHIELDEINENRLAIGLPTLEDEQIIHELKIINYPDTYGRLYKK